MRAGFERLDVGCWMSDDGEQLTEEKTVYSGPRTSNIQHPTSDLKHPTSPNRPSLDTSQKRHCIYAICKIPDSRTLRLPKGGKSMANETLKVGV